MSSELQVTHDEGPWSFIAVAAFLFLLAWWLHSVFTELESSGGTIRINVIIALLYKVFGKWGAVGLFGAFGSLSLYFGIRNFWQADSSQGQVVQADEPAMSESESARIDSWANLAIRLISYAPLVLTWWLLVYSTQEMLRFSALLPSTLSSSTRWGYTAWIIFPFSLPAIFSLVFRKDFFAAFCLFFVAAAMMAMSVPVFEMNISPSRQFESIAPLRWVPMVQLIWGAVLIHLLNKQRHGREA